MYKYVDSREGAAIPVSPCTHNLTCDKSKAILLLVWASLAVGLPVFGETTTLLVALRHLCGLGN